MQELEAVMRDMPQAEIETFHHFAHGTYTREIHIPAGVTLVGKIHRYSCINIVAKGRIAVAMGESSVEISAPHTFVSRAGEKKAGHALEDTVWLNVHPWIGEPNLELLEQALIVPSFEALEHEQMQRIR